MSVPGDGVTPTATFDASEGSANGGADLPWQQSYKAGQKDENGALIGGSEIMHIKEHQGKLFAFNGYWQDGHYPKSQSCQVCAGDPRISSCCDIAGNGTGPQARRKLLARLRNCHLFSPLSRFLSPPQLSFRARAMGLWESVVTV